MSEKISFEKNLQNLEEVVRKLENKEITLEDAMEQYQKGIKLSKELLEELKKAESVVVEVREE